MKKYLSVYKTLLKVNWYSLIEYRTSLFTRIFSSMIYTMYHVVAVLILTNTISSVFGWTRNELLLLASTYSVFIGLFHMFISRNMSRLSEEIYYGNLDFLLIKPIDSQFSASLWIVDFISLSRVIVGLLLSWYFLSVMKITILFPNVIFYVVVTLFGLSILYSIWLGIISFMIFNPRLSNIVDLLFHSSEIARYPREMYQKVSVYVFALLLPFTFVLLPPTQVLLNKFTLIQGLETVSICISLLIISRMIWKYSLRYYTSASS